MAAPEHLPLDSTIHNPAVPEALLSPSSPPSPLVAYHQRTTNTPRSQVIGVGPERRYISIYDFGESQPGYPARPSPGSVLDLDLVLEKCDLSTNQVSKQFDVAYVSMFGIAWNFYGLGVVSTSVDGYGEAITSGLISKYTLTLPWNGRWSGPLDRLPSERQSCPGVHYNWTLLSLSPRTMRAIPATRSIHASFICSGRARSPTNRTWR